MLIIGSLLISNPLFSQQLITNKVLNSNNKNITPRASGFHSSPFLNTNDSLAVFATWNPPGNLVILEWILYPAQYYECAYDDGTAEEIIVWSMAGNENAVKFYPSSYPCHVTGGSIYVGDGSFPAGSWMGTVFRIILYDDDGPNEMPGTPIDSVDVTVYKYGWIEFSGIYGIIESGNFYLSMKQLIPSPACPLGVDYTPPTYNTGYLKFMGQEWQQSIYQDMMIRAHWADSFDLQYYAVAKIDSMTIPCDPSSGEEVVLGSGLCKNWDVGFYCDSCYCAWGVAIVTNPMTSWFYSNILGNNNFSTISFQVDNVFGEGISEANIELAGLDCSFSNYFATTDTNGFAEIDSVYEGYYDIIAHKPDYDSIILENINLINDTTLNLVMELSAPTNLQIDTLTSWLTWNCVSSDASRAFLDYYVFLDSAFVDIADTNWIQLPYMEYNTEHEACVQAHYTDGFSALSCIDFTSGYLAPPRNLDGVTFDDAVHLWWEAPIIPDTGNSQIIPNNLLGYKLYRNDSIISFIQDSTSDTIHYYDVGLAGNCPPNILFNYKVTALYDMQPYGFPGDTGESYFEGPLGYMIYLLSVLPFHEQWNSGSFDLNQWEHGTNWVVNGQTGNPEPSAEFTGTPLLNYYSSSLISFCIDAVNYNDPFIDGLIWLDFDLKLESINNTGVEKFQVNAIINDTAYNIATYSNISGSFGWQSYHFNITDLCFGKFFKAEFDANGANSGSIQSWQLDNIRIYRSCAGPSGLCHEDLGNNDYLLKWIPPQNIDKYKANNRDLMGYRIYQDYSQLDFTQDTFYQINLPAAGDYVFEVTAVYEDCESDTAAGPITISVPVFQEEQIMEDLIRIFPNPAREILNIQSNQPINRIEVFDLLGNKLLQTQPNQKSTTLNIKFLEDGTYLIKILQSNSIIFIKKITILH